MEIFHRFRWFPFPLKKENKEEKREHNDATRAKDKDRWAQRDRTEITARLRCRHNIVQEDVIRKQSTMVWNVLQWTGYWKKSRKAQLSKHEESPVKIELHHSDTK